MRKRLSHTVWNGDCRGRTIGQPRLLALALALGASTMLSGCFMEGPQPSVSMTDTNTGVPLDDTGPWTNHNPSEKERLLAKSDFSMEIVRVTDSRRPRSMVAQSADQMIYQYDPDVLLQGVTTNVPSIMSKYLSYRPRMPKHYKVEMDIKKLVTDIKTGSLWSGHWGRYHVAFDVAVIVRRPDSTVALQKTFRIEDEQAREDYDGRGPTKERDRARMYDLSDSVLRKAAEQIGWQVRQGDARRWDPPAPQSIPTRLNRPSINRADGTTDADTPPVMLQPVTIEPSKPVEQAPIIVPSAPAGWLPDDAGTPAPEAPEQDIPAMDDIPESGDPMGPVI